LHRSERKGTGTREQKMSVLFLKDGQRKNEPVHEVSVENIC
jgi:hypothetical protein